MNIYVIIGGIVKKNCLKDNTCKDFDFYFPICLSNSFWWDWLLKLKIMLNFDDRIDGIWVSAKIDYLSKVGIVLVI